MALSEAARKAKNAAWRAWYATHKEQVKASHERSWERKAREKAESE